MSVALADLLPLIRQSIDWFEGLVREQRIMFEVRSSELETRLSSNDGPVEAGGDTAISAPREIRAFYAIDEVCGLDAYTFSRFKDRFQFPDRVRVHLPSEEERACHFFPGEVCFYEAAFLCGLRFPVHPFVMELLGHFGIAPRQLMPNSWRIVVSLMGIWLAATVGDMIRVDELVYLYCLKAFKEHGYYELCHGRGGLGSSGICLRSSDTGSPGSSLCLRMIGRRLLTKFGVISQGCSVGGVPQT